MRKKTVVSRHAPIYFVILSIICITFFSGCCSEGIDIKVKKRMTTNLDKFHTAIIVVRDYKYLINEQKANHERVLKVSRSFFDEIKIANQDRGSDNSRSFIDAELFKLLREKGLGVMYGGDEKLADLKVDCSFQHSLGCIHIGRHFNTECVHESFINLKFVDMRTKEIIGEVECTRPSFKRIPHTFIELMFNELMKSGNIEVEK